MTILNYLVAFSMVLISVVKTADIFMLSDKALVDLQKKFTKTTRELIAPPKGSVSLTAAVLTALLSMLLLFYVSKMKIEYAEAVYRSENYLCIRYLNVKTKKYIKEMSIFNWALRSAFLAKSSTVAGVQGEVVWKGLVLARNVRHFNYIKNMTKNKYCQFPETASYLKNPPFKLKKTLELEVLIDGTTSLRENQWSYTYTKSPTGIRLKKSFCLKSTFQVKNAFTPKTDYQSQEIPIAGMQALKCLSGPSS